MLFLIITCFHIVVERCAVKKEETSASIHASYYATLEPVIHVSWRDRKYLVIVEKQIKIHFAQATSPNLSAKKNAKSYWTVANISVIKNATQVHVPPVLRKWIYFAFVENSAKKFSVEMRTFHAKVFVDCKWIVVIIFVIEFAMRDPAIFVS